MPPFAAAPRRPGLGAVGLGPSLLQLLPLLLLLLAARPGRAQQQPEAGTCPTVPVQRAPEVTAALMQCEPGELELRLGFHSTAEAGFDSGALQGVAVAVRAINDGGLLAGWGAPANATIRPFYKAVGYDRPYAIEAALELTQEARVNAVIGGGSSSRSILTQYVFGLAGIPQVSGTAAAALGGRRRTDPPPKPPKRSPKRPQRPRSATRRPTPPSPASCPRTSGRAALWPASSATWGGGASPSCTPPVSLPAARRARRGR